MGYKYNPFIGNFDRVGPGSGAAAVETLTGNSGGAVGPDGAFNINILGAGSITVTGNPVTNTLTIDDDGTLADVFTADAGSATPSAGNLNLFGDATQGLSTSGAGDTVTFTNADATETQKGVSELATDAESIAGADSNRTIVPTSLKAKLGVQTSNAVPFGQSDSTALGWTAALTNGQLVIGATAGNPTAANLTQGNGITITNAANFIRIDTNTTVATQYDTDSGSATPAAHVLNILGGTGCATSGAGDTVTIDLDATVPLSFPTDSGTATPAANALTVAGGSNINTSGAGATVTVNLDTNISVGTIDCTQVTVDPGASGDSFLQFDINTTGEFRIGVDDDDGDAFKISQGSALGTNDTLVITPAGEVTFPLTSAFLATVSSTIANVTGDGTSYTVIAGNEIFDQNGDYNNTTGVFTAPVAGRYMFGANILLTELGAHTSAILLYSTSGGPTDVRLQSLNPSGVAASTQYSLTGSVILNLAASETVSLKVQVGGSTKTVDVLGSATQYYSAMWGKLVC